MKMFRTAVVSVAALALGVLAPAAFADVVGKVTQLGGPPGSVLVVRGAQTYALKVGDQIFDGDQVFTRMDGSVEFSAGSCFKQLGGASSITVGANICQATPISLKSTDVINGVSVGTGGGAIGATPLLLGLLAAGGGIAAASNGGGSASP